MYVVAMMLASTKAISRPMTSRVHEAGPLPRSPSLVKPARLLNRPVLCPMHARLHPLSTLIVWIRDQPQPRGVGFTEELALQAMCSCGYLVDVAASPGG